MDLIELWNKGKMVKYGKIEGKIENGGEKEKKYWKVWWNRWEIKQCDEIGDTLRSKETFCDNLGFVIIIFFIKNGIYNDNVGIQVK